VNIPCLSAVFRRECLDPSGRVNEQAKDYDDWDCGYECRALHVVAIDEADWIWRRSDSHVRPGSSAAASRLAVFAYTNSNYCRFRERWLDRPKSEIKREDVA
jgi:hypothetical protein